MTINGKMTAPLLPGLTALHAPAPAMDETETELQTTAAPDVDSVDVSSNVLKPPYKFSLEQIVVGFDLNDSQLRRLTSLLAAGMTVAPDRLGNHLYVISADFKEAFSLGSQRAGEPYQEVSYAVPVSYQGKKGFYFLKLNLNGKEPLDAGLALGYPKTLADVAIEDDGNNLSVKVSSNTEPAFRLEASRKKDLWSLPGNLVLRGGLFAFAAQQSSAQGLGDTWLSKNGKLQHAHSEMRPDVGQAYNLRVKNLHVPYLNKLGVVAPGQPPRTAYVVGKLGLTLDKPVNAAR